MMHGNTQIKFLLRQLSCTGCVPHMGKAEMEDLGYVGGQ